MIELVEYLDTNGKSPFAKWFNKLKYQEAAKVRTCLARIENSNFSQVKGIGDGIHECRIHWGAGYRVYFGKDGEKFVILLAGGTKSSQPSDIEKAKNYWKDYKFRKKRGEL